MKIKRKLSMTGFALLIILMNITFVYSQSLWDTAKKNKDVLTITTLFTAQNVRDYLSTTDNLNTAINWCKQIGITKVYIEAFRGGYYVDRDGVRVHVTAITKTGKTFNEYLILRPQYLMKL
jgi:hypothetical protein